MTQAAGPIADLFNSGWTPVPLFPELNKPAPNDATYVVSSVDPHGDTFTEQLSPLAPPGPGPQVLTVRLKQTAASTVSVTITLLQGSTVIATQTVSPPLAFTNTVITLTQAQINSITDYTNLSVKVTADIGTSSSGSSGASSLGSSSSSSSAVSSSSAGSGSSGGGSGQSSSSSGQAGCCGALPNILHASLENESGCDCLDSSSGH
jgi:hypothetical protein